MNRCLNDLFAYCSNKPQETLKDSYKLASTYRGQPVKVPCTVRACQRYPQTCPHYLTLSQSLHLKHPDRFP